MGRSPAGQVREEVNGREREYACGAGLAEYAGLIVLADLQKKADDAQKAADNTNNKYGNIKQEIIDLLKDFIGITDIEDCITKGSISACLWAAFDVASWVFAALKIAKFAKAVKDAIKLWKEFNKGRKIIDRAKDAAKRAKELLRRRRVACGLPAAFAYPNAPPRRMVHASFTYDTGAVTLAAAPAAKPNKCKVGLREQLRNAGSHGLPGGEDTSGPFRFRPYKGEPLKKVGDEAYEDRFGNIWRQGPAHGKAFKDGYTKEWDVQLSKKGEAAWKKYAKRGVGGKYYVNVTPKGYLSH